MPIARRRQILFLSPNWPLGKTFGGQLRALCTARALKQIADVTVMIVGSNASDTASMTASAAEFTVMPPVQSEIMPRPSLVQKIKRAFDSHDMNVHGVLVTNSDRERLLSCLPHYDMVWMLNSRTPNILNVWRWRNTHLDIDDVPSTYARAVSESEGPFPQRCKARAHYVLLKRREQHFHRRFTTMSVCSDQDREHLGGSHALHVIPNGFERPAEKPTRAPSTCPPRIGFIGLYSFAPNLDGVRWFLKKSWPALRQAVPGIRFRLVGKDSDGPLKPTEPDIDALGWLSDPAAEMSTWSAMVIPIRIGGGTRIKIADAFSRGCPVVSTRFGAHGYEVEDGKQLRLADTPGALASACSELVQNPAHAEAMANRAWNEFLQKWTWDAIAPKISAAAEDCLRRRSLTTAV